MARVAAYLRRSSPGEEDKNYSLDNQLSDIVAWAEKNGHEIVAKYSDPGGKSWTLNRPVFQQMASDARMGKFEIVCVGRFDRFSRIQVQCTVAIYQFREAGVEVYSATEELPEGAVGEFVRNGIIFAAETELGNIRARTYGGKRSRVHSGKLPPTSLPKYGYMFADDSKERYVPNPETAPIVQRIFLMYLANNTARSVAATLTKEGVPTPTQVLIRDGYKPRITAPSSAWSASSVFKLLSDASYVGRMVGFARKTVEVVRVHPITGERTVVRRKVLRDEGDSSRYAYDTDVCPPLVSEELFAAVQERLKTNRERSSRHIKHPNDVLLRSGIAVCGYCGHAATVTWNWKAKQHSYVCGNRSAGSSSEQPACTAPARFSIQARILDTIVWEWFIEQLSHPELIAAAYESYLENAHKLVEQQGAQLRAVQIAVQEAKEQENSYLAAVGSAKTATMRERFVALAEEAATHRAGLEIELRELQGNSQNRERDVALIRSFAEMAPNALQALRGASIVDRREALYRCKVRVRVWDTSHEPRYEISWLKDYVYAHVWGWTQFISRVA